MKLCGTMVLVVLVAVIGSCSNAPKGGEMAEADAPVDVPVQDPVIEEKAVEVITAMAKLLRETKSYRLTGEITEEEFLSSGQTIEMSREFIFTVRRGGGMLMDRKTEKFHRRLYFDGKTVSIHDVDLNVYSTKEHPGTNDELLDALHDKYGITVPLSDLAVEDPQAAFSEFAGWALYVGIQHVGGVRCHHLVLSSDLLEWQLWVQADGDPVPRKIVILYGDEPGEPRYRAMITKWEPNVEVTDEMLRLTPPAGAMEIDMVRSGSDDEAEE